MVAAVGAKSTWGSPSSPQSGKPGGTGSSSNLGKTTKAKSKGTRTSKLKKAGSSTSKANAASVPAAISNGSSSAAKEGSTLKGKKVAGDTMRSRRGSDAVREPDSSRNAMGGLLPKIKTREFGPLSQLSSTLSMTASALSQRALENLAMFLSDPALTAFAKSSTPPVIEESSTNIVSTLAISSGSIPLSFVNQQRPLTPSSQPSALPNPSAVSAPSSGSSPSFPLTPMQTFYLNATASSSASSVIIPSPTSASLNTSSAPNSRRPSVKATPPPFPRHFSEPTLFPSSINANGGTNNTPLLQSSASGVQPQPERDLRRRIIKQCLELKRHVDKEGGGLSQDSPLYKVLFSRTPGACGVAVLLKCLRILHDVDISIIVTNLLIRISCSNDSNQHGIAFLARRNAPTAIFRNLQGISFQICSGTPPIIPTGHPSLSSFSLSAGKECMTDGSGKGLPTPSSVAGQSAASLANSRIDELLTNILTLVCKLAKHDPKLPLIARLHGAVEYVVDILKRWHERKDSAGVSLALQTMKVFCNKAEVNVVAMQKKGALEVLANVLRGIPITAIKETNLMETLLELLTIFARSDNALKDMLRIFGTRFFVSLFSSTGYCESVQKCCLRLLRTIVDTEEGRKAFAQTDGIDVLTASLEMMALQSENSLSLQTTSAVNSIPSLLISVLRAAVSETDLPHLQLIRNRVSPLDAPSTGCYIDVSVRSTPSTDTFLRTRIRNRRPFSGISLHNTIHPFTIPTGESSTASIISTPPPSASSLSYLSNLVKDEPQDEEAEAFHLRSLCPEFDIVDRNGSLSIPPTTPLPLRPHKAVYPTNVLQPGAPLNVIRILEPLKPSPSAAGILNSAANVPLTSMSNAMVTTPPLNANEPLHPPPSSPASSSSSSHGASTVQPAICENLPECEPIQRRSTNAIRKTVFEQTTRILKPGMFTDLVVYDVMDDSVANSVIASDPSILLFESKFESGNLQLAIKASDSEYDLILQTDIGSAPGKHNQWFYFSVTNMVVNQPYKFNIINMSKGHSQFAEGMQPVVYSVCNKVWRRGGDAVCFYKNHYRKPKLATKRGGGTPPSNVTQSAGRLGSSCSTYSTLSFTLSVSAPRDILYVAYHYPYTVTDLSRFLNTLQLREIEPRNNLEPLVEIEKPPSNSPKFDDRCRRQTLCLSEGGNEVELLTITAFDRESLLSCPISGRVYIFLSSRVHPGESNSNYIMQGVIRFLMGDDDTASALRRACVFKIVPMLNPDGVINGSHRCGLAGIDLNREWRSPCKKRSPTIYWTKQLWKYIVDNGHRPLIACDFHGHSRKKNVFIFGCENVSGHAEGLEKIFPSLLASVSPLFDPNSCKYGIERSKEATARVVIWREMGVVGSYTLESTYCGADIGEKKGQQVQIQDLEKVGADFCCAILGAIHIFDGKVPVASAPSNKKESRQDSKDSSSSGDEK